MTPREFEGVELEEAPETARPKCPSCTHELRKLWIKKRGLGLMEQKQIIICPECECFLGFGTFSV